MQQSLFILGMMSSSFGLEWFEFLIGYPNYSPTQIPGALQKEIKGIDDETKTDPPICSLLNDAGVKESDLVLFDDFSLRYNCRVNLLITHIEGTAYMMSGKNELVWWYRTELAQNEAFGGNAEGLIDFAKKQKARYALVTFGSPLEKEFRDKKMIVSNNKKYSVIKFE